MDSIFLKTVVPIFLLIGTGFLSRKFKALKSGDEKVLSSYIYYFALPALLLVNMADIPFSMNTLTLILTGILPLFIALALLLLCYYLLRFSLQTLYLLIVCAVFGSHSFFGLPFVIFAFGTKKAEQFAVFSSSFIAMVSVGMTITILEMYKLRESRLVEGIKAVIIKLSRNPLIISIVAGLCFSLTGLTIPGPIAGAFHMLGNTAITVAIFMLGVSLYGRNYRNLKKAFLLALLRILLLPLIALIIVLYFKTPHMERSILILMHATPLALATIVLSERYNFYQDIISSLMLISSLSATLSMNLWLLVLGYR